MPDAGPPPWEPSPNPYSEYAFDLIPVPGARIRLEDVDPDAAAILLEAADGPEPGVAVPREGAADTGRTVTVRVAGQTRIAGRVPEGYDVVYTESWFRGATEIPLAVWRTSDGYVIDVLMDRQVSRR